MTHADFDFLVKFALFIFSLGIVLLFGYWLRIEYKEWKKRRQAREDFYELKYKFIQGLINDKTFIIDEFNYHFLKDQLMKLGQMEYRNKEKTDGLSLEFFKKYTDIKQSLKVDETLKIVSLRNKLNKIKEERS